MVEQTDLVDDDMGYITQSIPKTHAAKDDTSSAEQELRPVTLLALTADGIPNRAVVNTFRGNARSNRGRSYSPRLRDDDRRGLPPVFQNEGVQDKLRHCELVLESV